MSLGYSGSNFGIISTLNSGSGTLSSPGNKTSFSFENTQNYTNSSISVILFGTTPLIINLNLYYSQDSSGVNSITETISSIIQSNIFTIEIKSNYLKVELELISSGGDITYTVQTIYKNSVLQIPPSGFLSSKNSFVNQSISSGNEIEGEIEDVTNYSSVSITLKGSSSSSSPTAQIRIEFLSNEGNILKENIVDIQDITDGILPFNQSYTQSILGPFIKVSFENTSTDTFSDINVTTLYHISNKNPTIRVEDQITNDSGSNITKSILSGPVEGSLLSGGCYRNIDSFQNSLNINIRNPLTAFGEVLSAENTPFLQFDFTNGRPLDQITIYSNNNTYNDYYFRDSKGTIVCDNSVNSSTKKIELKSNGFTKYKPGQGLDNRFTGSFPNGYRSEMDQYVGTFTPEDSLCFGYFPDGIQNPNEEFGIRYQKFGTQQKNRITIDGDATSTTILIYNIGGILVNVSIDSGDTPSMIAKKSVEAINGRTDLNYFGYTCQYYYTTTTGTYYIDAVANGIYDNIVSSFSIDTNNTGSSISIIRLEDPKLPTTIIYPQSSWNMDTCRDEGTLQLNYIKNPSGFRLDPTKGNVYRITFQYLGFGTITFFIEQNETDILIPVHKIKYQNLNSSPSLKNPSMKLGMGITTNGTLGGTGMIESSSMTSFLQGKFTPSSIYRSFGNSLVGNEEIGVNLLTREQPGIICGIQGLEIFESINKDLSINYRINNSNIYFNTINFSINKDSTSTKADIILMLIKNPELIYITNTADPTKEINIQKRNIAGEQNNGNVLFLEGIPVLGSGSSITQSIIPTNFSVVFEYTLIDKDSLTLDISNLNILMSPTDNYYLCFYGILDGNGNALIDVSGSVSYSINM